MSDATDALNKLKIELDKEKREKAGIERELHQEEDAEHKAERDVEEHRGKVNKLKANLNHIKSEEQRNEQELGRLSRGGSK